MKQLVQDFAAMKRALAVMCAELGGCSEETVFSCKLVACELLSNVLQHGGGCALFDYAYDGSTVRIAVRGENGYRPPAVSRCADADAECGRGLFLVDSMALRRTYSEAEGIIVELKAE